MNLQTMEGGGNADGLYAPADRLRRGWRRGWRRCHVWTIRTTLHAAEAKLRQIAICDARLITFPNRCKRAEPMGGRAQRDDPWRCDALIAQHDTDGLERCQTTAQPEAARRSLEHGALLSLSGRPGSSAPRRMPLS